MTQATRDKKRQRTFNAGESRHPPVDLHDVPKDGPVFEGTDVPVQYLFTYLDEGYNLYTFLKYFPSVSQNQAVETLDARVKANSVVHSDRERVSGTPVFKGTRVPVRSLFNYLSYGYTVDFFLEQFPTVEREQALRALEMASKVLENIAYESAAR